jgi:DNA-binding YbaB/EbfC family protein
MQRKKAFSNDTPYLFPETVKNMFKGLGNLGNIASMVGSLQKLPEKMNQLNDRMKQETVSASSGCGQVKITMTGTGHVQSVEITPSLTGHELEQSIQDATNAAGAAAKQLYAEAIRELANELDLNLPGIDSMLTTLTGGR